MLDVPMIMTSLNSVKVACLTDAIIKCRVC